MDSNQNLDGLEDLPFELLISQSHHQMSAPARHGLPGDDFHQRVDIHQGREYSPFISFPEPPSNVNPAGIAGFSHVQQYLRGPTSTQTPYDHDIQARPSWSHLLTSGPTLSNTSSFSGPEHHPYNALPQGSIKKSISHGSDFSREPQKMLIADAMASSTIAHGSSADLHFQDLSMNNAVSHMNPFMEVSKRQSPSKVPFNKPVTVSTELASLESSGDYSPVSPPAAPTNSESTSLGMVWPPVTSVEMHSRIPASASMLPATKASDLPGFPDSISKYPLMVLSNTNYMAGQPLHGIASSFSSSGTTAVSPSDIPLDMSTSVIGKSEQKSPKLIETSENYINLFNKEQGQGKSLLQTTQVSKPKEAVLAGENKNVYNDEPMPFLQAMLKETATVSQDPWPSLQVTNTVSRTSPAVSSSFQDKLLKLPRSTPKKSNFYGRDASLFTFSTDNETSLHPTVTTSQSHNTPAQCNDSFKHPGVSTDSLLPKDISIASEATNDSLKMDFSKSESTSCESEMAMQTANCDLKIEPSIPTVSGPLGLSSSITQSTTSSLSVTSGNLPPQLANNPFDLTSLSTSNVDGATQQQASQDISEPTDGSDKFQETSTLSDLHEVEGENDLLPNQAGDINLLKKRKRKAPVARKPRKPVAKKKENGSLVEASIPQSVVMIDKIDLDSSLVKSESQSSVADDTSAQINVPVVAAGRKRGKKKAAVVKAAEADDNAPRRSSNRKSKDNAMRLIELQADSGFAGISEFGEEEGIARRSGRKRPAPVIPPEDNKNIHSKEPELSDLSDDSDSSSEKLKDKDDDYIIDEEEVAAADKEDQMDEGDKNIKKIVSHKKPGSLKISFKLSGDSSAEIVSGIEESPVKRKKRVVKKKAPKKKPKTPENQQSLNPAPETDEDKPQTASEGVGEALIQKDNSSETDLQATLMNKYFSDTAAKQKSIKPEAGSQSQAKSNKSGKIGAKRNKVVNKKAQDGASVGSIAKNKAVSGDTQGDNLPKFRCGYCPQRYHTKEDLLAHMDAHMSEMEAKDGVGFPEKTAASQPKKTFVSKGPSENNKKEEQKSEVIRTDKHDPESHEKHKCGECGKAFKTKQLLLEHVRVHTADKPFECDLCHKCFAERTLLSAHRKTHSQDNVLRCSMCSKAFIHKVDLDQHMKSHPKRSINISAKKPPGFDRFKKDETNTQVSKKNTSFASALSSGEVNTSSGAPSVLVLKRKEIPASLPTKIKVDGDTKKSAVDRANPATHKSDRIDLSKVKSNQDIKPDLKVGLTKAKAKQSNSAITSSAEKKEDGSLAAIKLAEKPKQEATPGVCTCKECPECVTRFLESFV